MKKTSLVAAAVAAALAIAAPAAQARPDHGRWNPPGWVQGMGNQSTSNREIWKTEFQVCWGPMTVCAYDPDVRVSHRTLRLWLSVSPQYAAAKLARVVEAKTNGWRGFTFEVAVDGCRNGLLWWHYHGDHPGP